MKKLLIVLFYCILFLSFCFLCLDVILLFSVVAHFAIDVVFLGFFLVLSVALQSFAYYLGLLTIASEEGFPVLSELVGTYFGGTPRRILFLNDPIFRYGGDVVYPNRVYMGDSKNISVTMRLKSVSSAVGDNTFTSQDQKDKKTITLGIRQDAGEEQYLEVELQAAAMVIDPEKKQRHSLNLGGTHELIYRWNCYFPNSGKHSISLNFNRAGSQGIVHLGTVQLQIKVVQFANFTHRQIMILASLAAIAGFIATIVGILTNVHLLFQGK